jgi:hypothetical protein
MVMILAYWFAGNGVEKGERKKKAQNSREIPIDVKLFLDHNQTAEKAAQYE